MSNQVSSTHFSKLIEAIDAKRKYKGVLPDAEIGLVKQLNKLNVKPTGLADTMKLANDEQKNIAARLTYNENLECWFNSQSYDYVAEFKTQVSTVSTRANCNIWMAAYSFILHGYDVEAAIDHFDTLENYVDNDDKVFGVDIKDEDSRWKFVQKQLVATMVNLPKYRPPIGLKISKRQGPTEAVIEMIGAFIGSH
jgi:hypothetical protein